MNLTQWLLLLVPALLAYGSFVFLGETNGRRNIAVNAAAGLFLIPLLLALVPFILLSAGVDLLRKRAWGAALGVLVALLAVAGYGALVFHVRDRPVPPPEALPLER